MAPKRSASTSPEPVPCRARAVKSWRKSHALSYARGIKLTLRRFPIGVGAPQGPVNEDCLFLNVYAPAIQSGQKLPVRVWIHGGAYIGGEAAL
jgi:carboxylesterase type B